MSRRVSKVFKARTKDFLDLSEGFDRRLLSNAENLARYGISGDIVAASYDQVQSLLALATPRSIHVLGQNGVEVVYKVHAGRDIAFLVLHASHLVAIDFKNTLYSWLLEGGDTEPVAVQSLRGVVTATHVDPSLDWLFLGMKDGTVQAWDLAGEQMNTTFKVKNQYFERQEEWRLMEESYAMPRYHVSPVVKLCIHPLDLGMLLITYADGAALYSMKEDKTKRYYECILPADSISPARKPALTCATFSPNGEYVLIGLVDGIFSFYDYRDSEQPLQVRNLGETDMNLPRRHHLPDSTPTGTDPILDLKWCCRQDPSDTFLLVAGGSAMGIKGVSILDFGKAPTKAQDISDHFATPLRQRVLPLDPRDHVLAMTPLGLSSPYYMIQQPRSLLLVMASGVSVVLDLPSGDKSSTRSLPPSLGFVHPPVTSFSIAELTRHTHSRLEIAAARKGPKSLLIGGAPGSREQLQYASCQILCSVHGGTIIRLYGASLLQLKDGPLLELDSSSTLPGTVVDRVALSGAAGELAIASESGSVVLYRLNTSTPEDELTELFVDLNLVSPMPTPIKSAENMLFKFDTSRTSDAGIYPVCLVQAKRGQITCLTVSEIGFVAIGYDSGLFLMIDLRGPAIFFATECRDIVQKKEKSIFKKSDLSSPRTNSSEYVTACAFLGLNLEGRLSLTALIGTSEGRCVCMELLKEQNGAYTALQSNVYASGTSAIRELLGVNAFGENARASGTHLSDLHSDSDVPDCVIIVSDDNVTSLDGISTRRSRAPYQGGGPSSAQLVKIAGVPELIILAVAQVSGGIECFSVPDLRPLGASSGSATARKGSPVITADGEVFYLDNKYELARVSMLACGKGVKSAPDALFDALKQPAIARPTISNLAWITGTQYVRPADLDLIISGGNRPLSKRALERLAAAERQQALLERQALAQDRTAAKRATLESARNSGGNDARTGSNAYGEMGIGGQERGERVSHLNDMYDNVSKASSEWLTELDKMASQAKKSAGKAAFKSLLGL